MATLLLEAGADPNYGNGWLVWQALVDERTETELLFAALNMMDRLPTFFDGEGKLNEGPEDLYRPNDDSTRTWTDQDRLNEALSYASRSGHLQAAAFLLDRGADINATAPPLWSWEHGSTALHKAANRKKIEMVRFLLDHGADPRVPDAKWNGPPAEWTEDTEILDLLKEAEERAKVE